MIIVTISIVSFLLGIAALLSATETAITAASPGIIHKKKLEGNQSAGVLLMILKQKDKVISTLLIGYSIISTLCTTIATVLFTSLFGPEMGTIIASIVMAFLIIVFAEVIPKAIAVVQCNKIALAAAKPLRIFLYILEPINFMLSYAVRVFCFIFRIDLTPNISAMDEVRGVIEHHLHEGNVVKDDRDMLGGILNIRNMEVSEIMVHRSKVVTIDINTATEQIISLILSSPHSRFPFWENSHDNIIGILHVKDLMNKLHKSKGQTKDINIRSLLIAPIFVPDTSLVVQQLHMFKSGHTHLACVVDEYGDLKGIVTLEDILEEIVGQIYDEHDMTKHKFRKISDNSFIMEGAIAIRDLNRELNWQIPENDAITLAGFIISRLQKMPSRGDCVITGNIKMVVEKKIDNRIALVKIIIDDVPS